MKKGNHIDESILFDNFWDSYNQLLSDKYPSLSNITVNFFKGDSAYIRNNVNGGLVDEVTPFAELPGEAENEFIIFQNIDFCKNLTDDDIFALLFHEFGHLNKPDIKGLQGEIEADHFSYENFGNDKILRALKVIKDDASLLRMLQDLDNRDVPWDKKNRLKKHIEDMEIRISKIQSLP